MIRRGKRYYEISILGDFFSIYVGVSFLEQEGNEWLDDLEECNVERNILLFSLFLFLSLTISLTFKRIELKWKYPVYNPVRELPKIRAGTILQYGAGNMDDVVISWVWIIFGRMRLETEYRAMSYESSVLYLRETGL